MYLTSPDVQTKVADTIVRGFCEITHLPLP